MKYLLPFVLLALCVSENTNADATPAVTDVNVPEFSRSGTFKVDWKASREVDNPHDTVYTIYRKHAEEASYTLLESTLNTYYNEILLPDGSYTYRIKACNVSCNEGTLSKMISVNSNAPQPPETYEIKKTKPPGFFFDLGQLSDSFSLTYIWDSTENTTHYQLESLVWESINHELWWEILGSTTSNRFRSSSDALRIKSCNETGCGESKIMSYSYDPSPCSSFPFCEQE